MRPPDPAIILDCGHVEFRPGHCATTDCPNYIGSDLNSLPMLSTVLASMLPLIWVRGITGRGAIEIIMDALPSLT